MPNPRPPIDSELYPPVTNSFTRLPCEQPWTSITALCTRDKATDGPANLNAHDSHQAAYKKGERKPFPIVALAAVVIVASKLRARECLEKL